MSQRDPFSGRVIAAKYAVKERIGAGGMGTVYRAVHEQTGGDVAVKFLHGTAALDEHAVKRFQLEAQNAAQLRHAHTIRVTDFGVDEGVFYLVMEHLVGHPLSDVIRNDGPMPWRRAVHITRQILGSLWEAHEHPRIIIHRDIKPANIFVMDLPGARDHVKVLDFGIARSLAGTGAGTQGFIGTPFYMAPELWRGEIVDARTDLYALGCVVFELLAGAPPFTPPPSATEILLPLLGMHCHDAPPRTVDVAPRTPPELGAWVDRLLRKDRAERPPSAREALEELDRVAREADHAEIAAAAAAGPRTVAPVRALPPIPARAAIAPTEVASVLVPGPAVTPPAESRRDRGKVSRPAAAPVAADPAPSAADPAPASAPQSARSAPAAHPPAAPARSAAPAPAPAPIPVPRSAPPADAAASAPPAASAYRDDTHAPRRRRGPSPVLLIAIALAVAGALAGLIVAVQHHKVPDEPPGGRGMMTFDGGERGALQYAYRARLGGPDHYDADGDRHTDAAAVLVQDRANYHFLGRPDVEDGSDPQLGDAAALAMFAQVVGQALDATMAAVILDGTPLVEVEVYANGLGVEIIAR